LVLFAIGYVASRPGLHRFIKIGYRFVPGLQAQLRRLLPAQSLPEASLIDDNEPYVFKPSLPATDASGTVTVEHLYHLSRSL
jgi:hypothetical protein